MSTMYDEKERVLTHTHLSNFGLNPFALDIIVDSYMKKIYPLPMQMDYVVETPDGTAHITFAIKKPGFLGGKAGLWELLDEYGLRMFLRSYFESVRPQPVSFLYKGLEIHLETPGTAKKIKNLAREIFDPTK